MFACVASVLVQRVYCLDRTLVPGENGTDVVRAVISKIVFSNISFNQEIGLEVFMRTMAFVETRDGTQLNTSTSGGGIWNISEYYFGEAKSQLQSDRGLQIIMELQQEHTQNHIRLMDWDSLVYENLTVPLYSGLIARILIHSSATRLNSTSHSEFWTSEFKGQIQNRDNINMWIEDAADLRQIEHEGKSKLMVCKL